MSRRRRLSLGVLIALALLPGCEFKDSEVRKYIDGPLATHLDSLTRQLCRVKAAAAPDVGEGSNMCPPEGDGYRPPPTNGKP